MSDIVIQAENLGKKYTIGHQAENGNYTALRDVLVHGARGLWHKTKDLVQGKPLILGDTLEDVWALKDINFEIRRGEATGIIGRNGAGKSTLLKILSRITEPSVGRVALRGRVASLLEVGTGFHPELSGRENIYLNGAILGMTRQEIRRKFDEIVAFAEVERFLDTPVKRYSSGMYVRLAFAVAAHLEPEILVVDEVLAVGDAAFQKKCLGKMEDVSGEGRTVLFVSHNMAAIRTLCSQSILLDAGRVACMGPTAQCIDQYLSGTLTQAKSILTHVTRIDPKLTLESITINGSSSDHLALPSGSRQLLVEVEGSVAHPIQMELEVRVQDIYGSPLAFFSPGHERGYAEMYPVGPFSLKRCIELPNITHGTYYLSLHLTHPGVTGFADIPNAVQVAAEGPVTATGFSIDYEGAGWVFLQEKPIHETR